MQFPLRPGHFVRRAVAAATFALAACHRPAAETPAAAPTLRVMTYNIAAGNGDLATVAEAIRSADAHLVALQEVDVHWGTRSNFENQARRLADRLAMEMRFAAIYRLAPPGPGEPDREYGVALLSRYPITAFRNDTITRLSTQDSNPAPTAMPGFLNAKVDVRGTPVRVFNTHLDYRPDPAVRAKQVAEMLAIIGVSDEPTLLFGDLNAPPAAPELQPLFTRLRDAWPAGADDGFTYPAGAPVRRIDYVLASPHFRVLAARVPATSASDHRPVVVDLSVHATRERDRQRGRTAR